MARQQSAELSRVDQAIELFRRARFPEQWDSFNGELIMSAANAADLQQAIVQALQKEGRVDLVSYDGTYVEGLIVLRGKAKLTRVKGDTGAIVPVVLGYETNAGETDSEPPWLEAHVLVDDGKPPIDRVRLVALGDGAPFIEVGAVVKGSPHGHKRVHDLLVAGQLDIPYLDTPGTLRGEALAARYRQIRRILGKCPVDAVVTQACADPENGQHRRPAMMPIS